MAVSTVKTIINGQEYTLSSSDGVTWTTTVTAPTKTSGMNNAGQGPGVGTAAAGKGYYDVAITATDEAGNTTTINSTTGSFAEDCRLKVYETVAPVAAFTYPTASATITSASPAIAFRFTDDGSGVNPQSCKIKIDGGDEQAVTLTGSGTTFTGTFTPSTALADGQHTVTVYAYDYDENKSNVASVTFTVDTTPPTLVLDSPVEGITNVEEGVISGTTNDVTSSPVTVTATLNGVDVGDITVNTDGTFSKAVTWSTGANTVVVKAVDSAGKETIITRIITLDTGAPVFKSVVITENPSATGTTVTITVTVED